MIQSLRCHQDRSCISTPGYSLTSIRVPLYVQLRSRTGSATEPEVRQDTSISVAHPSSCCLRSQHGSMSLPCSYGVQTCLVQILNPGCVLNLRYILTRVYTTSRHASLRYVGGGACGHAAVSWNSTSKTASSWQVLFCIYALMISNSTCKQQRAITVTAGLCVSVR